MKVRMRSEVTGLRDGKRWPNRGEAIDLPDDEALTLIGNGTAEPLYDPTDGIEMAVLPPGEVRSEGLTTANVPTTRTRIRK